MIKRSEIEEKIINSSNLKTFYSDKFIGINNKHLKKMLLSHDFNLSDTIYYSNDYNHIFTCNKCKLTARMKLINSSNYYIPIFKQRLKKRKHSTEEVLDLQIVINKKIILTDYTNNIYCDSIFEKVQEYINILDILE